MKSRVFISILFISIGISLNAQRDTLGRYSPGFRFNDGVYGEFGDFRANCPSIRLIDLKDEEGAQIEILRTDEPWYILSADTLRLIDKSLIWGMSSQGQVFVRNQDFYDRLVVIGALCHLIQRETYLDYSNSQMNGYSSMPVKREAQVEFFIDLRTGEKKEFTEREFEPHLADDPILLHSFRKMTRKQRKLSMYRFLHSYNDEHPAYFPISKCRR